MLNNIRSALNVGAIFRTCDGAGVEKLYLTGITPYPPHNRIPKTALGAIDMVDWERHADGLALLKQLKEEGHQLIAVEQSRQAVCFNKAEYKPNCVLILGHEITGVDQEILDLCDTHVEIPMFGEKESLNVATTTGILAYHVALELEQYGKKTDRPSR